MKNKALSVTIQLLVVILMITSDVVAQNNCNYIRPKQADNWVFGQKGRISFNNLQPDVVPTWSDFGIPFGSSSISDKNGNLLIFSNGETVWNRTMNVISNGTGLKGSKYGGQSAIIVPNPGNSKSYFVFTPNRYFAGYFTDGINYSTVDFSNNQNGEVTSKNISLLVGNTKTICAIQHANKEFYWLVVHGYGDSNGGNFYSYLVDTSGVVETPVISTVGHFLQGDDITDQFGYLKASSDGNKLAMSLPLTGMVELFNFDNSTGMVSNAISTQAGEYYFPFGVEFSPDNTKLYISTSPKDADTSYLIQFDLELNDPFQSPIIIKEYEYNGVASDSLFNGLQLSVDGKIYVSKTLHSGIGMPNLGVIYNPNRSGLSCNYNELDYTSNNGLYLEGALTQSGLPDFVSSFLDIPHFFYLNQCLNDTTNFIIRNTANIEATWNFKDPAGYSDLSNPMSPLHVFSESGTFEVELNEAYDGDSYSFSEEVIINPLPSINIGGGSHIIYILNGSSIRLDAGDGMDKYQWQPGGSSDQFLDVADPGVYIATVTDFNCCTNSDTVEIRYASLSFPNAFHPSSPLTENQTFKVIGDISAINKYQFRIFNRWGQLIFETDDPAEGWDGNIEGSAAPYGTYVYSVVFTSFESGIQSSIDIKERGTVTLIR